MDSFKDIIYKNAGLAGMAGQIDDIGKAVLKRMPKVVARNAKTVVEKPLGHLKNYDEILAYLTKEVGETRANEIMKNKLLDGGTGSLFADMGLGIGKKVKPLKPKIEKGVLTMKRTIDDIDMKAGNILGKNNRIFDQKYSVNLGKSQDGMANDIKELTVKRLTAPFSKTKDAVLPMAGAFAISSKLYGEQPTPPIREEDQYGRY